MVNRRRPDGTLSSCQAFFLDGLYIIPILAFLVLIHEFGHFITARMCNVTVEEFGIGLPPRLKGWTWRGVLWSINAIPFGGFVRVLGEDGKSMEPGSMNTKPPHQRAFFLAAGAGMNFIVAIVLMILLVGTQGLPHTNLYVDRVMPDTPAAKAGLQPGDQIVGAGGQKIEDSSDLIEKIRDYSGQQLPLVIQRGSEQVKTTVVPRANPPAGQGPTGIEIKDPTAANVLVGSITPGDPADKAGLLPGDKIVSIDGQSISDTYAFSFALQAASGRSVPVVYLRDGEKQSTQMTVPRQDETVVSVAEDGAAAKAGWKVNDRLVSINGKPVLSALDMVASFEAASGKTIPVVINRGGKEIATTLAVPKIGSADVISKIGVGINTPDPSTSIGLNAKATAAFQKVPFWQIIPRGISQAYHTTVAMLRGLRDLFTGAAPLNQVAGPIGMGQLVNEAIKVSPTPVWVTLTNITIVLSLNLAVLNLLPLPALDGGRLLFVLIEILRGGRRIAPEKEGIVHFVGIVVLIGLMFVVAFGDINRIFDHKSFLP